MTQEGISNRINTLDLDLDLDLLQISKSFYFNFSTFLDLSALGEV